MILTKEEKQLVDELVEIPKLKPGGNHYASDRGCRHAREALGYSVQCINCPFPECYESNKYKMKLYIITPKVIWDYSMGLTLTEIMSKYRINKYTIDKILDGRHCNSGKVCAKVS